MATDIKASIGVNGNQYDVDQAPAAPTANQQGFDSSKYTMSQLSSMWHPAYQQSYDSNTMGIQGMNYTPSKWLSMSKAKSDLDQMTQRENASKESASAAAGVQDSLAAKGGLSSGALERSQEDAAKNYLGMSQDLTRQGNINDLAMGAQDYTTQMGAKKTDVANQVAENQAQIAYNKNVYDDKLSNEALDRQAAADAQAAREKERRSHHGIGSIFK